MASKKSSDLEDGGAIQIAMRQKQYSHLSLLTMLAIELTAEGRKLIRRNCAQWAQLAPAQAAN